MPTLTENKRRLIRNCENSFCSIPKSAVYSFYLPLPFQILPATVNQAYSKESYPTGLFLTLPGRISKINLARTHKEDAVKEHKANGCR